MRIVFLASSVLCLCMGALLLPAVTGPLQFSDARPADAQLVLVALTVWCALGALAMLLAAVEARRR